MELFYRFAIKLSILLWAQVLNVEAIFYGAKWEDGVQKFTILCPDDATKPAYMLFANAVCYSVGFEHETVGDNAYFYFLWDDDDIREEVIELLNTRDIIPGGVDPDGLTYIRFPSGENYSMLDVGDGEHAGEALDPNVAAGLYGATTCEE
ncbi:hypothetical protein FOL47_004103 [Perkinsus chesapeaki]|uniref:Uncharacterized protein n=1 Tax=Perkinsus chesapeaki TaxID=330153 RepID=A0A7J6M4P3_PERCH|nr:hypothetical protein FOL47_004103 [Perkinsus chesapeaki]